MLIKYLEVDERGGKGSTGREGRGKDGTVLDEDSPMFTRYAYQSLKDLSLRGGERGVP